MSIHLWTNDDLLKGGENMEQDVADAIEHERQIHQPNREQDVLKSWVGRPVKFVDPVGKEHHAIITYCFSVNEKDEKPMCVNLVYVIDDDAKTDQYGRQLQRYTSVTRKNQYSAHGMWFDVE